VNASAHDPVADTVRIPVEALRRFGIEALTAAGLPPADAEAVADLMVDADLTGAEAHGMFRLPQYVQRILAGGINPRPDIRVNRTAAATALVDGDNGMGHLVMSRACETAISLARESGVGWVGVRRSNHAGPAALYAERAALEGMIGLYSAVASANHMAVWGGAEPLLGTNPLAIAIPAGAHPPFVLDMATTVVSYGTVKNRVLQGKPLGEGWMVDRATGQPMTDSSRTGNGLLLPIGGYKGSGLALALGLLAGTMNGAAFGREVVDFNADDQTETNTGHFITVVDPARFGDANAFGAETARQLADLTASETLPGASIRMPGQNRPAMRAERGAAGIPFSRPLLDRFHALAERLQIANVV
jgi:L-2-hydroxycarboxylate dehydrogenase (NAD+)